MVNTEQRKRKVVISFRVDDKEKKVFDEWSETNHIGLAPLVRFTCLKIIDAEQKE